MKKIIPMFLMGLMFTMLFTSCTSMYKSAAKDSKITNGFPIHSDAQVGDYAIQRVVLQNPQQAAVMGTTTFTYEMIAVNGSEVTFTITTHANGMASFMNNIVYEITTDRDGKTIRAFLIDGAERTELQVAQKGDDEYNEYAAISSSDLKLWNIPTNITVPAGSFNTEAKTYENKETCGKENIRGVYLGNRDIKFFHASTFVVEERDGEFISRKVMELIEQGNR